jgi:hypothetical protein
MEEIWSKYSVLIRFCLSWLITTYWLLDKVINVYAITFVGVIYELLWLPMVVLLFVAPVFNLYVIITSHNKAINYLILLVNCVTLLLVFLL